MHSDLDAMLARARAARARAENKVAAVGKPLAGQSIAEDVPALAADVVALVERVRALEHAADQAGCALVYAANRVHVEAKRRPGKAVLERIGNELIDKRLELEERIGWQCGRMSAAWYRQREQHPAASPEENK